MAAETQLYVDDDDDVDQMTTAERKRIACEATQAYAADSDAETGLVLCITIAMCVTMETAVLKVILRTVLP